MPKLNNKGISFIPVLVLSLLVGVIGALSYKYYSSDSNSVLQMKDESSNQIELSLNYSQQDNDTQSGTITLTFSGNEAILADILKRYQKYKFIEATEYCMNINCKSDRKKILAKSSLSGKDLVFELPVTNMVWTVSVFPFQGYEGGNGNIKFKNSLKEWETINLQNRAFRLIRLDQKPNISVNMKSLNPKTGQQNLEFKISGNGPEFAGLVKALRVSGITRVDNSGTKDTPSKVKIPVTYKRGQVVFNFVSLKNTKSIVFPNAYDHLNDPQGISKYEFSPLPSEWVVNKDSNGLDSTDIVPQTVKIKILESKNNYNNPSFNFEISGNKSSLDKINSTITSKGISLFKVFRGKLDLVSTEKPKMVCSESNSVCKFTIDPKFGSNLIRFNFEGVKTEIEKIPGGWKADSDSNGIKVDGPDY